MENKTQVNCSCSLITISYQVEQPIKPSSVHSPCTHHSHQSVHIPQQHKISLSRSTSKQSFQNKQKYLPQSRPSINLNNSISHLFPSISFDSKLSEYDNKMKKKFLVVKKNQPHTQNYVQSLQPQQIQRNTTLDTSFQIRNRIFYKKTPSQQPSLTINSINKIQHQRKLSKYNQNQQIQKYNSRFQIPINLKNNQKPNPTIQSQTIKNQHSIKQLTTQKNIIDQIYHIQNRRIKPLKELQCRHVKSSGKISSENHVSMVISQDSDLNIFQPRPNLLHKSYSPVFHQSQTSQLIF